VLFFGQNGAILGIVWLLFWVQLIGYGGAVLGIVCLQFWVHFVGIKGTTWWLFWGCF